MKRRVLVVEDDPDAAELLQSSLRRAGFHAVARSSGAEALRTLEEQEFGVVVTDLQMHGMSGIELCRRIAEQRPNVPVIVITAFGSLDTAVSAIRAGAYDFITKPFEMEAVELSLARAFRHRELREEVKRLRAAVAGAHAFEEMLGGSPEMQRVYDLVRRVADSDATVLVTGESGTGKEIVARALHRVGPRSQGPFVAINCAALPEPLLESELFGHVRGAFTDAKTARAGLLVQASGGTLFLDEIGDMPLGLQPKLLRALEERTVRPVGSSVEVRFDARIVAATNQDIETAVEEGRFREDLYYRVNVITIHMPPLRARGGDILLLAQHFVERFAAASGRNIKGISAPAAEKLLAYSWPGNVRELRNCMERAVALARFDQIMVDDLPDKVRRYRNEYVVVPGNDPSELVPLEDVERRYILKVVEAAGGNKSVAAKILGLNRKTLYRKLATYGAAT